MGSPIQIKKHGISTLFNRYSAEGLLKLNTEIWFVTAFIGQVIFAAYIIKLYGGASFRGDWEAWNSFMPHGYQEGRLWSNAIVFLHIFMAGVITIGGPLQLIPALRKHFPAFHRINGRIYLGVALLTSITGILINLLNKPLGSQLNANLTAFNGVLIIVFSYFVYSRAKSSMVSSHRRWGLRLFMAASGVWFFRIGLMFWLLVNSGPVGFDPETFEGPALTILNAAQFILPLAFLEMYFRVEKSGRDLPKVFYSMLLILLTLVTATGIFGASMMLWFPYF
ncbi:DUF2306 domain-containing protein [Arthrospiribacter ruber]|uniref:DUF2306 domain-containing protein n=1 Tax=Arthrospiribacter ruber TaxID=2487934 RepID=A0A951M796_9BACT|nr:DUF2306 domain-containing protein [Arthrospiribacter ruber]MBW3466796.1 DUF2306 domain-containing protein [Arthrospiribacter ruber]MBW3469588.1 DUF2306 domain-containing protein [Arthrospiribacter ruber]MBW3470337.1 DUF2306 domain-containing protein [Arthrospiribacter ruber]